MTQDASLADQTKQLLNWFNTPLGMAVTRMEQACLDPILAKLPGYHLLSLGAVIEKEGLRHSPILHQLRTSPEPNARASVLPSVRGSYQCLPFQNDSIDVIVAPHILEFQSCPQAILQEIWRVLIPEGRLILFCFHRYSLWGLWQALGATGQPWQGHFFSRSALCNHLIAANFTPLQTGTLFFRPPLVELNWLQKLQCFEKLSQTCFKQSGGVIFASVKKQLTALTPLKPCWPQQEIKIANHGLEPTTRNMKLESDHEKS